MEVNQVFFEAEIEGTNVILPVTDLKLMIQLLGGQLKLSKNEIPQ